MGHTNDKVNADVWPFSDLSATPAFAYLHVECGSRYDFIGFLRTVTTVYCCFTSALIESSLRLL